jgi:hypothetical protein
VAVLGAMHALQCAAPHAPLHTPDCIWSPYNLHAGVQLQVARPFSGALTHALEMHGGLRLLKWAMPAEVGELTSGMDTLSKAPGRSSTVLAITCSL